MKKKIIWITILLVIGFLVYQAIQFFIVKQDNINSIYLIPSDAIFFFEMDEPISNLKTLSKSEIWDHFQTNEQIHEMSAALNAIDSMFQSETDLFEVIGDRDLIVSTHMIKRDDYGFLYIVDLGKLSRLNLIKKNINQFLSDGFKVTKRSFENVELTEITDQESYETLTIGFIENQMIASYTGNLVEKSITEYQSPTIGRDLQFLEVQHQVKQNDLLRFYLNHKMIKDYYRIFSNEPSENIDLLTNAFTFSGWSIDEKNDKLLTATGATTSGATTISLIRALEKSGTTTRDITEVIPESTAFFVSFAFEEFKDLHDNFYDLVSTSNPETLKTYEDGKKRVEKFLDISLEHDFYEWVDDEIAFATCLPAGRKQFLNGDEEQEGLVIVLKSKDVDVSTASLNKIQKQIRKRTPVKFKTVTYRDYQINYLEIKGFFKLILGSMFERIEKPYYTTIDDYVVFSNSPKTLKLFIDSYEERKTLARNDYFIDFEDEFYSSSNVFLYVNTNLALAAGKGFLTTESKELLAKEEPFFSQLTQIGVELIAVEDRFDSKLALHYDKEYDLDAIRLEEKYRNQPMDFITVKDEIDSETIFRIDIFPNDFTASRYETKYSNGKTKSRVSLKDGKPDGVFKEYYANGDLKISGRYKKGEQTGTWKVYGRDGKLFYKRKY
ncbi:Protein of unknown function [Nonlabens sp. Hel1_33_55]|uniref:DUF3352 domain-containing protein n=1 Tax=Nonlabens sp. Hel1_33_55 TaxID=1336802 RepID=UPI000875EBEE|nr:DUF3352 domain-containing protein [Nonlabens sp. Hel1_33_55]SCY15040.1 Protein of unknown function [Nonlabens sp. Hel1_33_55]